MASPICLRLFAHWMRAALSRAFCTAGRSNPISREMMPMTTSNSIRVNPDRRAGREVDTVHLTGKLPRQRLPDHGPGKLETQRARPLKRLGRQLQFQVLERSCRWLEEKNVLNRLAPRKEAGLQ